MIKTNKQTWKTILISPEMRFWLMSEKAKRQLVTYDQVLKQLKELVESQ